jgi:hypothetical protein
MTTGMQELRLGKFFRSNATLTVRSRLYSHDSVRFTQPLNVTSNSHCGRDTWFSPPALSYRIHTSFLLDALRQGIWSSTCSTKSPLCAAADYRRGNTEGPKPSCNLLFADE